MAGNGFFSDIVGTLESSADADKFCRRISMTHLKDHEPLAVFLSATDKHSVIQTIGSFGISPEILERKTRISDGTHVGKVLASGEEVFIKEAQGDASASAICEGLKKVGSYSVLPVAHEGLVFGALGVLYGREFHQCPLQDLQRELILIMAYVMLRLNEPKLQVQAGSLFGANPLPRRQGPAALTPRQLSIADLVREGLTNTEIAEILRISTSLVKLELARMFRELSISSREQLRRLVLETKDSASSLENMESMHF